MHNNNKRATQIHDWYCSFHVQLMNLGIRFGYTREEVRDFIHQFFLDLLEKKVEIEQIIHPKAFVMVAFRRKLIDYKRRAAAQRFLPVDVAIELPEEMSLQEQLERVQNDQELIANIKRAYKKLPARCQKALRLKYFEGHSMEEISVQTGLSKRSIYNNLSEGIKMLRAKIIG